MSKILVIGESCRDVFVHCEANRLCPDLPVPVLNILNERENPGMAWNVYRNIHALVPDCDLLTNANWEKITKTRFVHEKTNHLFIRVDAVNPVPRIDLNQVNYDYELIVISDYDKGFLSEEDIEVICSRHKKVFIDTKKVLGDWVKEALYIKINDYEYKTSEKTINESFQRKIIHTMGADGCEFRGERFPVNRVEVKDSSGAGDTFMAGLVIKYFATGDIFESIRFANSCAAKVVTQRGVTTL